jgi:hypothetical protein
VPIAIRIRSIPRVVSRLHGTLRALDGEPDCLTHANVPDFYSEAYTLPNAAGGKIERLETLLMLWRKGLRRLRVRATPEGLRRAG